MTRLGLTVVPLLLGGLTAFGSAGSPTTPHSDPPPAASWPLLPGPDTVAADFDPPAEPWLAGNRGIDLAGHAGEAVHAATDGVVSFAGTVAGIGVVTVTDGALRTTYEPLQPTVRKGQQLTRGMVLGRLSLAGSHCLPQACLHWGLLRGSDYLDPLALLGLEQVRLLPVP
ncbi:MAG TPA: M23 family metallopeptidase [Mycobacteriales bacterium]|jgi:murein DD-endopeptidase MepM/ murein hydrolase activator NlpD|nr:M23 family metallopeptidase [Mycobacteriales bacterium]